MSKRYRLSLMGISLIILIAVGTYFTKSLSFIVNDFWFASGLLLLILLSLVDQPFFSKDCNIFVNAVTAALSLLLIPTDQRTLVYWIFLSIVTYLIVSSYVLMWLRKYELNLEHPIVQILTRINRQLGRPEAIFSSFFLWGAIRQYKLDSTEFNALLWFWVIFMLLNVPSIANTIDSAFDSRVYKDAVNSVGKIFGVQSKNTFLVKLSTDRKQSLKLFDFVEFQYSIDNREHIGIVLDVYLLDQEQWIKVLTTPEIDHLFSKTVEKYIPDQIYKVINPPENDYLKRFVGLVYQDSVIEKIRFSYNAKVEIYNGQLIELTVNSHKVLYQVVQGITKNEQLSNKNESSFIIGEAIQLGEWNDSAGRFEQFGWVPSINTPLFLATPITPPAITDNEYVVGCIPNTNYPVIINKEYPADIDDDTAEVTTEDDITIIATDIPEGAAQLMVVPVPKTEREAWVWITACLKDTGTPIHTFDIYFEDADGNRVSANGAKVTIDCPHCSGTPKVCSLTTSGAVRVLNDSAQGATVTFTTDGSAYYVIADKAPADHPGDSDIPQTGDNSHLALWSGLLIVSLIALFFLVFWKRRKKGEA